MSIPAANGHVWKPTSSGMRHQFQFDDQAYQQDGTLQARCGAQAEPVLEQPLCPHCLVQSPANDTADQLERQAIEAFPRAAATPLGEELLRDR